MKWNRGQVYAYWLFVSFFFFATSIAGTKQSGDKNIHYKLPSPAADGKISFEKALQNRRSVRVFKDIGLDIGEISQLLWASQGITDGEKGLRTAPSAGALYPLEVYLMAGNVKDLEPGLYKYVPKDHSLIKIYGGDKRKELMDVSLKQASVAKAPAVVIISGIPGRAAWKYRERALRYVHMESGAVAQNIYLQAETLNLGTVYIGAFEDDKVGKLLKMPDGEIPLCIMPVGKR